MKIIKLKGGSLSGTYLYTPETGQSYIRKDVSLIENREYGFQRWYSQLKRLQRYEKMFPGVFPKLIGYGRDHDLAYFNMEYINDSVTVHEFLSSENDHKNIDKMFSELTTVMQRLHGVELPGFKSSCMLYVYEEIEQKINACMKNIRFQEFSSHQEIVFNGKKVPSLRYVLQDYIDIFSSVYLNPKEAFTHGNLTLENILYQPNKNKIIFIDPYEENIIDSKLAEYSQILQSSNSLYETYNSGQAVINANSVSMEVTIPEGLKYFDQIFKNFMGQTLSISEIKIVRLLEISQFARMLPFKMEIDEDKMLFFYALGSYLFYELRKEWES